MYVSTFEFRLRAEENVARKLATSIFGSLLVAAFVLACAGGSLAQNSLGEGARPGGAALATRPREAIGNANRQVTEAEGHRAPSAGSIRRVFVRSTSIFVRAAVVEDKLLKRPEFQQLGFVITREESDADLILELRHDVLTKYVFSVVDPANHIVLASGKLSSLGGTVAGKVAKRFMKVMSGVNQP